LVIGSAEDHCELVVPSFALAETLSVLRRRVHQGLLPFHMAEDAMGVLFSLPLEEVSGVEMYRRAWEIAGALGVPTVYDAVYLAVAELRGATFWTADEALYRKVSERGYVRLLQVDPGS